MSPAREEARPPASDRSQAARRRRVRAGGVVVLVLALVAVLVVAAALARRNDAAPRIQPEVHSLFGGAAPSNASADDDRSVQVGVTFTSSRDGWVSAVRFYRGPRNAGPHDVTLWGPAGDELASARHPSEGPEGWQEVALEQPVPVRAGAVYTVSYRAPQGHYSTASPPASVTAPAPDEPLTARGGVYTYGSGMPRETFRGIYYLVDVTFWSTPPSPGAARPAPVDPTTDGSPSGGRTPTSGPGDSTTGVPAGTALRAYSGPTTITQSGAVIDGADVSGGLVVAAKGVVIRRSKIHDAPEAAGVLVADGGSVVIEDTEIYGVGVGIANGSWTALRVDIHGTTSDGVKIGSDVYLRDSWIHDGRPGPDAHWDGAQVQSGITGSVVQGNRIDATGPGTNAALFVAPDLGPSSAGPLTIKDNWLDGGNYTLFVLDGADGRFLLFGISVEGNRFGRAARYGPTDITVPVDWVRNVWEDDGEQIRR